ncbi:riboflavin biosynthesis protein RibF [Alteribacillus iranensis]|uniref:Riboflavin biosynthesis protein n=1 Tax=Alteribacillus iranensis TaxID=930128 RepID=A0A1I2A2X0_9BACI|nr:riboflavin biosynthesis protein RibF [Alteribacillus iranensis]SFE38159.1 FMN adenylyltransferase /riboflavin kinase [Alteribacillus iranensis]
METIYLQHDKPFPKREFPEIVLALGYFDGIHKGHQKVIQTAKSIAVKKEASLGVMTFHPPPLAVLSQEVSVEELRYITPLSVKEEQLAAEGVDYLFIVHFNHSFSKIEPQEFIKRFVAGINAVHTVAGFDFSYGHKGKGKLQDVPEYSGGVIDQTTVEEVTEQNKKISSTRTRDELLKGYVDEVKSLLGRPYITRGIVENGEKRGRTIGFPTANIAIKDPFILPPTGVYAVQIVIDGETFNGVCNVGYKPTFHSEQEGDPVIEVHIFDFDRDIYGKHVEVEWHFFIREEIKFSSVEELKNQITKDKDTAASLLRHE